MTEAQFRIFLVVALAVVLGFEFVVLASRASLLSARLARLLAQTELDEHVRRTSKLLQQHTALTGTLHAAQLLARLLTAGVVLALLPLNPDLFFSLLQSLAALLLIWLALFLMEEIIEGWVARQPERWALRLTDFASTLRVLFYPLVSISLSLRQENGETTENTNSVTEDELKFMVEAGHQEGVLEQDERKMIFSIFRLGDTLVREIMSPRIYLTALDVETGLEQSIDALLESGYSRVPVYEETVDNVVGLLYAKDLLSAWHRNRSATLRSLLRPAYFVPEAKRVDDLLEEMQAGQVHMAIVVDEYGGVAGLVTLEDIVEEIVGEIRDEFDKGEEEPVVQVSENEYLLQARLDIDDFNELMGTNLPREEAETLGGFVYSKLRRAPSGGEQVKLDGLTLTIEQISGRRIRQVRAVKELVQVEKTEKSEKSDKKEEDHGQDA